MPLGDSITAGVEFIDNSRTYDKGGYRTHLWKKLSAINLAFDFVGSQTDGPSDIAQNHEGHPGWKTSQLIDNIKAWYHAYIPDIILLMSGTNDIVIDQDAVLAYNRLVTLVDILFKLNARLDLIVASITPLEWSNSRNHLQPLVLSFNSRILQLVKQHKAKGHMSYFADVHSAMEEKHLIGSHPSPSGYEKIAEVWFSVLRKVITDILN
jgi:lysophospholipase L1-like esterase